MDVEWTTAHALPPVPVRHRMRCLGTLGDARGDLTCSMYVARASGIAEQLEPFASFEDAADALKQGAIDGVLVPGAYPRIGVFIMDDQLAVFDAFVMRIPDLVLACRQRSLSKGIDCLYHHPATSYLLSETGFGGVTAITVASNVHACEAMLSDDTSAACITNQLCAHHFGLQIVKTLRQGLQMPWVCFRQKGAFPTIPGRVDG